MQFSTNLKYIFPDGSIILLLHNNSGVQVALYTLVPSVVIYHKGEVDWGTQLLKLPTEFWSATNIAFSKIVRKTSLK